MRRMKDSGIEWIGEIPENWTIVPLKYAASFNIQVLLETTSADYCFRYVDIGSVSYENGITEYKEYIFGEAPSRARRIVSIGDTIISTVRTYLKAIAYINDADNVIVSTGFSVLTPEEQIVPKFLFFSCLSEGFIQEVVKHSSGIAYPAINEAILSHIPILIPSYSEQQAIAAYLDEKCSAIDSVIARQQRLISLLKDYRLSLINDSISNNGGIKVHLGYVASFRNGLNFNILPDGNIIKFLGVGDFKDRFVLNDISCFSEIILDEKCPTEYLLKNGDMVFVRSNGSKDLVGRCIMVDNINYPLTYSGFCIRLRITRTDVLNNKYLLYFFRSHLFRKNLEKFSRGSNISNINQDLLSGISINVPSIETQNSIAAYLDGKCSAIDSAISKKQSLIDSLTEYKKSLIYETVTGKREVPCA